MNKNNLKNNLRSNFKKIFLLIAFVGIFYTAMVLILKNVGLENAQDFIKNTGVWAPIVFIFICAVSLIFAPLSGSSIFITGGILFGKQVGFIFSFIATIIGCSINFWISRKLGRKIVNRFVGENNLTELDNFINRFNSRRSIIYMILIMPISQDIISYAIGLTKINYWNFLIALIISATVVISAYIYIGTSLLEGLINFN
ncbi:MAG: TVP38/TMEM64 family protein [Mastigocoleus sp.]